MDALIANLPFILFCGVAALALTTAILVVAMRNPVHSALFLLVTFTCVGILFVMKAAEFVAATQILVYAGGIMVLFLFVVMLINVRHLPQEQIRSSFWAPGLLVSLALFGLLAYAIRSGGLAPAVVNESALRAAAVTAGGAPEEIGNAEAVGLTLYRDYLVPFEVASLFLLVAMIGAIVIGKRELSALEEETSPQFIIDRAQTEHDVKEAMSA